jgi:hypothetical protein
MVKKISDDSEDEYWQSACPTCGLPEDQWMGDGGRGFEQGGELYCCEGCAEGAGCTCSVIPPSKTIKRKIISQR